MKERCNTPSEKLKTFQVIENFDGRYDEFTWVFPIPDKKDIVTKALIVSRARGIQIEKLKDRVIVNQEPDRIETEEFKEF